jgi:hypothetical protein
VVGAAILVPQSPPRDIARIRITESSRGLLGMFVTGIGVARRKRRGEREGAKEKEERLEREVVVRPPTSEQPKDCRADTPICQIFTAPEQSASMYGHLSRIVYIICIIS